MLQCYSIENEAPSQTVCRSIPSFIDSDTTAQNANSKKKRIQVGVRKAGCCRAWLLYPAKVKVSASCHGGLNLHCCGVLNPGTVIRAGIRTGNSVFVMQKMDFACVSYRQSGIPGAVWEAWTQLVGLEARSEQCRGPRGWGSVVCTVLVRQDNPRIHLKLNLSTLGVTVSLSLVANALYLSSRAVRGLVLTRTQCQLYALVVSLFNERLITSPLELCTQSGWK